MNSDQADQLIAAINGVSTGIFLFAMAFGVWSIVDIFYKK